MKATKINIKHLLNARLLRSHAAFYRELDLLADQLTLAIPEYEIVLEHNPSTRQDYILIEGEDV